MMLLRAADRAFVFEVVGPASYPPGDYRVVEPGVLVRNFTTSKLSLDDIFVQVPYSAPITAMLRNGFSSLSPLESTIVIVGLFALGFIVLRIAVRLFLYGPIENSKKV